MKVFFILMIFVLSVSSAPSQVGSSKNLKLEEVVKLLNFILSNEELADSYDLIMQFLTISMSQDGFEYLKRRFISNDNSEEYSVLMRSFGDVSEFLSVNIKDLQQSVKAECAANSLKCITKDDFEELRRALVESYKSKVEPVIDFLQDAAQTARLGKRDSSFRDMEALDYVINGAVMIKQTIEFFFDFMATE